MATLRKHYSSWQALIRISGQPNLAKSFKSRTDAKRWSEKVESRIRREEAGVGKIVYPTFAEVAERYLFHVTPTKRCARDEGYTIKSLMRESWSLYPLNKITANVIGGYRDRQLKSVSGTTVCRRLDVVSTIFTQCKKEWGYRVDNPVLTIRRPKKAQPRDRRFTDEELNTLITSNHCTEKMRYIIRIALATAMRQGEVIRILPEHLKGNTLFIPVAKTKPRTIPLTKDALELIKSAPLPFNLTGDYVSKQFTKLCKKHKIKDAHFHDIRKNSLTDFMLVRKLSVPETMMIAGHEDPRMLLKIYNNLEAHHVAEKLNK